MHRKNPSWCQRDEAALLRLVHSSPRAGMYGNVPYLLPYQPAGCECEEHKKLHPPKEPIMVSTRRGGDYTPEKTNPSRGGRKREGGVSLGGSAAAAQRSHPEGHGPVRRRRRTPLQRRLNMPRRTAAVVKEIMRVWLGKYDNQQRREATTEGRGMCVWTGGR
jgi:hypothetical protein